MRTALIAAALALVAGPAFADQGGAEVEAFMANYIKLWNADDAQAITTQIYKFDAPGNPLQTVEGFQQSYQRLKAAGYDHSDLHSIHACQTNANTALGEMRFARVNKAGQPYAPGMGDLATIYLMHKTADGWRVGAMIGMDPSAKFECTSYTPSAANAVNPRPVGRRGQ